jgi:hypothetical protein
VSQEGCEVAIERLKAGSAETDNYRAVLEETDYTLQSFMRDTI